MNTRRPVAPSRSASYAQIVSKKGNPIYLRQIGIGYRAAVASDCYKVSPLVQYVTGLIDYLLLLTVRFASAGVAPDYPFWPRSGAR